MNHCNQCGTTVNPDAKFCQNCGAGLKTDAAKKSIDANLKVALTNETTEKVLKGVSSGVSSVISRLINVIKKLIKPVMFISIVGVIITGVVVFIQESQYKAKRVKEEVQKRKAMTFEVEKAIGVFQIEGMSINGRFLSYYEGSGDHYQDKYSDSWPYDGNNFGYKPTGRVTISGKILIVHLDLNRDRNLSENEKTFFKIKSISKSSDPKNYRYGFIETDLDENINFIINNPYSRSPYNLLYSIGEDQFQLWLR